MKQALALLIALLLRAGGAHAAIVHVPLESGLDLKPGESHTVTVAAAEPVEIGWLAVQGKPCTTNCIEATDMSGGDGISYSVATKLGASKHYTPVSGRIVIQYKNVSTELVTIDIFRVRRTCEAEACKLFDPKQKGDWLVFKVDEFKSITTSTDGSYSIITGVAESGRPFTFKAVWWTEDKSAVGVKCDSFVKGYLDRHTPKDQYRPYVISGRAVGDPANIVLKSVDTCAPKAAKFGVPDKNVFK